MLRKMCHCGDAGVNMVMHARQTPADKKCCIPGCIVRFFDWVRLHNRMQRECNVVLPDVGVYLWQGGLAVSHDTSDTVHHHCCPMHDVTWHLLCLILFRPVKKVRS